MSTISASTTSTTAYKVTADTTGTLVFQTGATPTTAMTLGTDQSVTFAGTQTYTGAATFTSGITVQGLTVGRGAGAVATNTAVGASALAANTSGIRNTVTGNAALATNSTGSFNSAFGYSVLNVSTGSYNTAVGSSALEANTTGGYNTAVGYQSGYTNQTGGYNTFVGVQAGYTSNVANANNTCIGAYSGYGLTTGKNNTFIGANSTSGSSGYYITTGSQNTILGGYNGNQGGLDIRTASNYIVLSDGDGNPRGYFTDTGGFNTAQYIKSNTYLWAAGVGTAGGVYLGSAGSDNGRICQASGGAASTATYIGTQQITTSSDVRLKENIVNSQRNALELIDQLRVVDHTWNDPSDQCETNKNSRGVWMGLIAQEAQPVIPWLVNKPKSDVDENGDPQYWFMDYGYSVPFLIKAIQELKAELDTAKAQIAALQGASA